MICYIVQLEEGVWLCGGEGDPPRTIVRQLARRFPSQERALSALQWARTFRQFKTAKLEQV